MNVGNFSPLDHIKSADSFDLFDWVEWKTANRVHRVVINAKRESVVAD